MKFVIFGDPIPKARHRSFVRYGQAGTYDPQVKEKEMVRRSFRVQIQDAFHNFDKQTVLEASNLASAETLDVEMRFYLPVPKSWPQSKKNAVLWGFDKHKYKPDVSNLIKFYEDAANTILFHDDSMIYRIKGEKFYSEIPRTEITIMPTKKTLQTEIQEILGVYNPEHLISLLKDSYELYELYDVDEADDWVRDHVGEGDVREVRLARTAYLLSRIADQHANLLKKISRNCPGFWQRAEKITKETNKEVLC